MNIRETIDNNDLTIKQFADSIYVSERTVYNWLSGTKIPRQKEKQIIDKYQKKSTATISDVDSD